MSPLIVILVVSISFSVFGQDDIDDLINEVFTRPPTSSTQQTNSVTPVIDLSPYDIGNTTTRILPPDDQNCTCVYFYLCDKGLINQNGKGIIDIRSNNNPCGNKLLVCCELKDRIQTTPPVPVVKTPAGCGHRNKNGVDFKITGDVNNEAQFGEFPWMVALLRKDTNTYKCGGSLIHPQVVLTATHCVIDRSKTFKIRAGEWDSQHTSEPYPFQERNVKSISIHPNYRSGSLYNDVAVLILESPVYMAENIGIACLPPQDEVVESGRCFATGWGNDVFGKKGQYQVILKKIELPLVSSSLCQERLRTTRLGRYFELHPSFICAGGEPNIDTCKGDGGSPLVCPISGKPDRYYQAGIVAWGIGCGDDQIPGVYANVAKFRNWIDEQMNLAGLDPSSHEY